MSRHAIRLHQQWAWRDLGDDREWPASGSELSPENRVSLPYVFPSAAPLKETGGVLLRRFHRPTGMTHETRVCLKFEAEKLHACVELNGQICGQLTPNEPTCEFDVTTKLAGYNTLKLQVRTADIASPSNAEDRLNSVAPVLRTVVLEIEEAASTSNETHPQHSSVPNDVAPIRKPAPPALSFLLLAFWVLGCGTAPAVAQQTAILPDELSHEGWIALFDGETMVGWQATTPGTWRIEDHEIVGQDGAAGFLQTKSPFADFELHVEFWADADTNSGVFVRSANSPSDPTTDCYEVNIAPETNPFPTGSIVGRVKSTSSVPAPRAWHSLEIRALGDTLTVQVNGVETVRYVDPNPLAIGVIGLQYNQGPVRFRNVRLRPLGLVSLLSDPQSITDSSDGSAQTTDRAWRTAQPSTAKVVRLPQGDLRVTGGPDYIESRESFDDFVLRLECRTNAPGVNSGIFFRCIPGERWMGYESQIHNGFDGTREHPTDGGTGGIFRRCQARRVVPNDEEWFTMTVVAAGPHLAVWVNGYQVSDWTDDRPEHDNPREGCRLTAGPLQIQAHDPSCDVQFRKIEISSLPRK